MITKLQREKDMIYVTNDEIERFGDKLRYNLSSLKFEKYNKKNMCWVSTCKQYKYFRGSSINNIECDEDKFKQLILRVKTLNSNCYSISTFLERFKDAIVYENFIENGIKTKCSEYNPRDRLTKPYSFYSKNTIKFIKEIDYEITRDFETSYINNKNLMEKIIDVILCSDFNKEEKKKCSEIFRNYSFDYFKTLVVDYKYEILPLLKYVVIYLINFEGFNNVTGALSDLSDYYRMGNIMGRNIKKYPKYLKSVHDIIDVNYKAYKQEYDEISFKKIIKSDLEFIGKDYSIIVPKTTRDIINEGISNNNCVGSYVNSILENKTYILFLRLTETPEESLITLELRDNKFIQAKGYCNREMNEEEEKFLKQYCSKFKIGYCIR
jgi:hypothetical protein